MQEDYCEFIPQERAPCQGRLNPRAPPAPALALAPAQRGFSKPKTGVGKLVVAEEGRS